MIIKKMYTRKVLTILASVMLVAGCGDEKPEVLIASAKQSLVKNDNKTAVIQIKNALQNKPDSAEARFLLGTALFNLGDSAAAEIEFEKSRNLKYSDDLVIPSLAKSLLSQGKFKKITDDFSKTELQTPAAVAGLKISLSTAFSAQNMKDAAHAFLQAALLADPDNADALIMSVRNMADEKNFSAANELIDKIIKNNPKNPDAFKLKGDLALYEKNDADAALVEYKKSIDASPNFALGHFGVIGVLLQKGDLDAASQQVDLLKVFAANNPQTKYFQTQLAYQRKDFKLARDLAQQLLKISPDNARSLQLAGAVEYQLNSLLQAEIYLNKAVTAAPGFQFARRLLVMTYLRAGQPAKALATLTPALEQKPVDPSLFSIAGEVYLQNEDLKKAGDFFAKAAKLDPQNTRNRTALALTRMMSGDAESAFSELHDIALSDKGTTADMALINAHLRRKEFDRALKAIDGFEKKEPQNPLAWSLRGKIQLAQKDISAARKSFEAAVALNPTYFSAIASLASLDVAEKKPDDAKKRFENVLVKDPANMQAFLGLAELRLRTGGSKEEIAEILGKAIASNPTEAMPRVLLADLYLRNKEFKLAFSTAQSAVAALPASPEALSALGRAQQALGDTNQALSTYNKLSGLQPASPQPFLRLADVNLAEKNKDAAIQNLNKALDLKSDLVEAQSGLVILNVSSGKFQEALNIARTVQKQRPKETVGYMLEGDVYIAQKKWNDAVAVYRTALKQAPSVEPAVKLHATLVVSGNKTEADKFSTSWLKDYPKDVGFIFYLADAALVRKDLDGAEKLYTSITQIQPNNSIAYNNLAWIAGQLKKGSALKYAETANSLTPNQPAFMDTMAMLLADKGDYSKAVDVQSKAIALQSDNNVLKMNLAKIYIKSGDKGKAKPILNDLSKLGDKFSGQAEVSEILKSI